MINIKYVKQTQDIINKYPSRKLLAVDLSVTLNAVHQWYNRGKIPSRFWLKLVKNAEKHGLVLSLDKLARISQG